MGGWDTEEPYLSTRTRKRPHARATDTGHARAATQKRRRIPEHAHAKATTRTNNIDPGMPSWVNSIDPERHSGMPSWVNSIDPERRSWVNTINPDRMHTNSVCMQVVAKTKQKRQRPGRAARTRERCPPLAGRAPRRSPQRGGHTRVPGDSLFRSTKTNDFASVAKKPCRRRCRSR